VFADASTSGYDNLLTKSSVVPRAPRTGLGVKAGNPVLLKLANASVPFLILTTQY
jgi:hypothetical protein